jgi:hypothetical protein
MATKSPGCIASIVIGSDVAVVAPVVSKFSRYSPVISPLVDSVENLGAVFS